MEKPIEITRAEFERTMGLVAPTDQDFVVVPNYTSGQLESLREAGYVAPLPAATQIAPATPQTHGNKAVQIRRRKVPRSLRLGIVATVLIGSYLGVSNMNEEQRNTAEDIFNKVGYAAVEAVVRTVDFFDK